ncbi:hexose kinase [Desemzia incerta]|uniref:hexose kinase n=1 Tax=Desemzia incerta TaxID=82801 RepID=UPI0033156963
MILTVTMNPSVDISYPLETLTVDSVNRVKTVSKTAGGKGLNVTRVINELGGKVTATGVLGGHLGRFIMEQLDHANIPHQFYSIMEETRNSIALLHDKGQQTEILEAGPTITKQEAAGFLVEFEQLLSTAEWLTISGSLPKGLGSGFYSHLIRSANEKKIPSLLDTSGAALKAALESEHKPTLIKPNLSEINELLGIELDSDQPNDVKAALSDSLFQGVEWIVVTLGGEGAIVKKGNQFYKALIPKVEVVNPVGSGDATIAGLAYAFSQGSSTEEIIKTGMTTGILNALESTTGHIATTRFYDIYEQVEISTY